ncbi:MAG: hypothetical protein KGL39_04805 [Patescibacteria group bacterium]|nr:hypothetical protein [Patescibacteria group bacterium]
MGEHQCPVCHRITIGFEQQEFERVRDEIAMKDAEIEQLRALLRERGL